CTSPICADARSTTIFVALTTSPSYSLSLHDALPIYRHRLEPSVRADRVLRHGVLAVVRHVGVAAVRAHRKRGGAVAGDDLRRIEDRKSTRLNSSHVKNSYAVFCLKNKKKQLTTIQLV